MDLIEKAIEHIEKDKLNSVQRRFGKLMIGVIVGFLATELAERLYDHVMDMRSGEATIHELNPS